MKKLEAKIGKNLAPSPQFFSPLSASLPLFSSPHLRCQHRHQTHVDPPKRVLGSVVAVAFQITFCAEMHANDFFIF